MGLMLTTKDLEARLHTTPPTVDVLVAVGVIDPNNATEVGNIRLWPEKLADELTWPEIPNQHPPALVVKVKGRQELSHDEAQWQGRDHSGWTPGLHPMDKDQILGIDRWWRIRQADELIGSAFLVSARGWIIATYIITGTRRLAGLTQFELAAPTEEIKSCFNHRRIPSKRGAFTERLPDTRA